jgi:hypothetical protein
VQDEIASVLLEFHAPTRTAILINDPHLNKAMYAMAFLFSVLGACQLRCILKKGVLVHQII